MQSFTPPLYVQSAECLRAQINSGALALGQPIPTEAQLERQFDVCRETVRDGIGLLRQEGLVGMVRRGGRNTVLRRPTCTVTLCPGDCATVDGDVIVVHAAGTVRRHPTPLRIVVATPADGHQRS
jgi:DNA-binding transcriptional MocR family regulator